MPTNKTRLMGRSVGIEKQPSLWTAERKRKLLLLVETSVS
jgi:hypothetical protein